VLFSAADDTWKVCDFGITTEGTSRQDHATRYQRGTSGYRAPEIIKTPSTYNNKVDIWALGCILFELGTKRKVFENDWDVSQLVALSRKAPIPYTPHVENTSKDCLRQFCAGFLELNPWKRPRATDILGAVDWVGIHPTKEPLRLMYSVEWHGPDLKQ